MLRMVAKPRRAWIYVLSVAALLLPAAGIAYLGAVSYRDERGAIAAQDEAQRQAAIAVAGRISQEIDAALGAVERAAGIESETGRAKVSAPLAQYWFWIDADAKLRVPRAAPAGIEVVGALDRGAPCAAGGRLEDCVRELSTRQSRVARLHQAQQAEACRGDGCSGAWAVKSLNCLILC